MSRLILIAILISVFQLLQSHSFKPTPDELGDSLDVPRNITCTHPRPAKIFNWHIHLLYFQTNKNHTAGAFEIRDKFIEKFKTRLGPQCKNLFYEKQMCMFEPDTKPVGPFLTAQWSVFFMNDDFYDAVSWIMQHKGVYDILVHPNTGCEMHDHDDWAMWGGQPWEINMDAFGHDWPWEVSPWPKKVSSLVPNGKSRLAFLS